LFSLSLRLPRCFHSSFSFLRFASVFSFFPAFVAVLLVFGVGLDLVSTTRVNGGDNPDRKRKWNLFPGQEKCLRLTERRSTLFPRSLLVEAFSFSFDRNLGPHFLCPVWVISSSESVRCDCVSSGLGLCCGAVRCGAVRRFTRDYHSPERKGVKIARKAVARCSTQEGYGSLLSEGFDPPRVDGGEAAS
jgi:hypothetical protein